MDIQQLRYFVSVAEHLNFTEAAKDLFITQPALSKQILNLEKYFGVQLFFRDKRFLRLTEVGDILLNEAYEILEKVDRAKNKVVEAASGYTGKLKIGYIGHAEKNILPQITRTFRYHYPGIGVNIIQRRRSDTIKSSLIRGDLDLGFIFLASLLGSSELDWEVTYSGNLKIGLPFGHPLANKKRISISELADEYFVFPSRETVPHYDYLVNMCETHGFSPKIITHVDSPEELLLLVESGIGISILSDLCETFPHFVNFVDFEEDFTVKLAITWNKTIHNPAVPLFVRKFRETVQLTGENSK